MYVPSGLPGLRPSALNCACMYATVFVFAGRSRRAALHRVGGEILDVLQQTVGRDRAGSRVGAWRRGRAGGSAVGLRARREREHEGRRWQQRRSPCECAGRNRFHVSWVEGDDLTGHGSRTCCHDPYIGFGRMKYRTPNSASARGSLRAA